MKIVFLFFFLTTVNFVFGQEKFDPNKNYKAGDVVLPTDLEGQCGCPEGFYIEPKKINGKFVTLCKKWGAKKPKKVEVKTPESVGDTRKFQAKDPMAELLLKHGETLDGHSGQLKNHEGRITKLETPKVEEQEMVAPEAVANKTPEVEVVATNALPTVVTQKEKEPVGSPLKWYRLGIGPFVEGKFLSNKNPLYGEAKNLFVTTVGLTLKSQFTDGPAKNLELSFSPGYSLLSKKKNIVDNSESILPRQNTIKSIRGVLLQAEASYKFLGFGQVFVEGGYSPNNKELPNQGIGGGLGIFYEPKNSGLELELFGGVGYNFSCTETFLGARVSYNFWLSKSSTPSQGVEE